MDVPSISSRKVDVANMPLENLAANKNVSENEKIAQASRAFEAVLLRQILSETQKPVFPSKFVGNSTTDGIYRDEVVSQLADNISKSGSFGLGKSLAQELQRTVGRSKGASPQTGGLTLHSTGSSAGLQAVATGKTGRTTLPLHHSKLAPLGDKKSLKAPAGHPNHSNL